MTSAIKDQLSPVVDQEEEVKEVTTNTKLEEEAIASFELGIALLRNNQKEEAERALTDGFKILKQI